MAHPSNHVCKVVMAVTGTVFAGFVVVHMIGNLKVWQGADALNSYAAWLREVAYPLVPHECVLWALRIVLAVSVVSHVWCRAQAIVGVLADEFGPCSTYGECVEVCPAGIPLTAIAAVGRERLRRTFRGKAT